MKKEEEKRAKEELQYEDILLNLDKKSDTELRKILARLYEEEAEISYKRRLLHGKIDILRAELTDRLARKHERGEGVITEEGIKKLSEILARGNVRHPTK